MVTSTDDTHGEKVEHIWNNVCRSRMGGKRSENMCVPASEVQPKLLMPGDEQPNSLAATCRSTSRLQLRLAVAYAALSLRRRSVPGGRRPA